MSTEQVTPIPLPASAVAPTPASSNKPANLPVISLVTLAIIAVLTVMTQLGPVIIPLLVALFLFFMIRPAANFLLRWNVPRWITYVLIIAGVGAVGYGLQALIAEDAQRLAQELPKIQDRAEDLLKKIPGTGPDPLSSESLTKVFNFTPGDVFHALFGTAWHFIESALLVLFYLVFMLMDADRMPQRISVAFPSNGPGIVRSFERISEGISRFLRVKTLISLGMATSVAAILAIFGVSNWMLWAIMTFLLNYITYVGSLMALVPPILISLVQFDHMGIWLALVSLLFLNRFLWIDFIEIRYIGQQLRINNVLLLFSIVFWGWFWGVTGMVLAVPMISAVRIILSQFDRTRSIAIMISED